MNDGPGWSCPDLTRAKVERLMPIAFAMEYSERCPERRIAFSIIPDLTLTVCAIGVTPTIAT